MIDPVSDESLQPLLLMATFLLYPYMGERERESTGEKASSGVSSYKGTNTIHEGSQRPPNLIPSYWTLQFQYKNCEGT